MPKIESPQEAVERLVSGEGQMEGIFSRAQSKYRRQKPFNFTAGPSMGLREKEWFLVA